MLWVCLWLYGTIFLTQKRKRLRRRKMPMTNPNEIARVIVNEAFRIRSKLGPGLLESVYESILCRQLIRLGLHVERQVPVTFEFEGAVYENAFKLDLWVARSVIVEIKVVRTLTPVHFQQTLSYVKLTGCKLGLLINFGAPSMREGIKRVVNGL
jgi:GxxExxY protein